MVGGNLRAFDAVATALQVESKHGEMNSLLVSAVQLRGGNQTPTLSGSSELCVIVHASSQETAALGLSM